MIGDFVRIDYRGFLPGNQLQTQARLAADKIQEQAPSDSFIQVEFFSPDADSCQCQIRLQSQHLRLVVEKQEISPELSLKSAQSTVLEEIHSWKMRRVFLPAGNRDPANSKAI